MHPFAISSIFSFPYVQLVDAYLFFLLFPSRLPFQFSEPSFILLSSSTLRNNHNICYLKYLICRICFSLYLAYTLQCISDVTLKVRYHDNPLSRHVTLQLNLQLNRIYGLLRCDTMHSRFKRTCCLHRQGNAGGSRLLLKDSGYKPDCRK